MKNQTLFYFGVVLAVLVINGSLGQYDDDEEEFDLSQQIFYSPVGPSDPIDLENSTSTEDENDEKNKTCNKPYQIKGAKGHTFDIKGKGRGNSTHNGKDFEWKNKGKRNSTEKSRH